MRRTALSLVALTIVWLSTGLVFAQSPAPAEPQDPQKNFHVTDTNDDGAVDRQEYQRRIVDVFYFADKNKDGIVVIEELQAIEAVDAKKFKAADKNGDKKLTADEFAEVRMLDFEEADVDKNGTLTVTEVEAWSAAVR